MVSNARGQVNHLQFQVKTIVLLVISFMISVHKMDCISLKCAIFVGGRGSAPDPAGGLTAPPRPPAGLAVPVTFSKLHPCLGANKENKVAVRRITGMKNFPKIF